MSGVDYVEVIGGLELGIEYVIENSFLIKVDVFKDGVIYGY